MGNRLSHSWGEDTEIRSIFRETPPIRSRAGAGAGLR